MATKKKMSAKKKTKRGRKQDAARVSNQKSELSYEARKTKTSTKKVRAAKKVVGVSRKKIEKELKK